MDIALHYISNNNIYMERLSDSEFHTITDACASPMDSYQGGDRSVEQDAIAQSFQRSSSSRTLP